MFAFFSFLLLHHESLLVMSFFSMSFLNDEVAAGKRREKELKNR